MLKQVKSYALSSFTRCSSSYIRKVRILEKWSNEDDLTDQFSNAKFALMVNRKPLVSISSRNISLRILQSSEINVLEKHGFTVKSEDSVLLDAEEDSLGSFKAIFGLSLGNMTRLDSITAVPIDKIRDLANSLAGKFIDLRWAMFTLPAEYDRNLLSKMYSLSEWNRTFKRCPRCASFLSRCAAKTSAACGYCQSVFYPPISPAIICLVTNRENSHALLVHLPRSPNTVYTLIAGYVQNGESLVEAVRREVGEEAGVDCDEIVQLNMSQSWPIQNNSIMCAFRAVADPKQKLDICKNELLAANWFSREEVQWAFDNTTRNLNHINESIPPKFQFIYVPPYGALSNRMIKHWLGEKP